MQQNEGKFVIKLKLRTLSRCLRFNIWKVMLANKAILLALKIIPLAGKYDASFKHNTKKIQGALVSRLI